MINYGNPKDIKWDNERDGVIFSVLQDDREIISRVSHAAIEDHFGNPRGKRACLTAAKKHFDEITDQVGHKIALGAFEPDGSILLKSADWGTSKPAPGGIDPLLVSDKADLKLETSPPDRVESGEVTAEARSDASFNANVKAGAQAEADLTLETKPRYPDNVPTHIDHPALEDELGRRGFARALVARMRRVEQEGQWATFRHSKPASGRAFLRRRFWDSINRLKGVSTTEETPQPASRTAPFIIHIHGPWGAGKTSLLEFMRQELQPAGPDHYWVVVSFNAWLHQRIGPPWWALMNELYWQAQSQLRDRDPKWARSLWRNQMWWWFGAGIGPYALTIGALVWIFSLGALETIATAFTVGGVILLGTRALLLGSARGATAALEIYRDPLRPLVRHFGDLVRGTGYPIAIFIDELDRCDGEYVVQLLQGIQTLFHNFPRNNFCDFRKS